MASFGKPISRKTADRLVVNVSNVAVTHVMVCFQCDYEGIYATLLGSPLRLLWFIWLKHP